MLMSMNIQKRLLNQEVFQSAYASAIVDVIYRNYTQNERDNYLAVVALV